MGERDREGAAERDGDFEGERAGEPPGDVTDRSRDTDFFVFVPADDFVDLIEPRYTSFLVAGCDATPSIDCSFHKYAYRLIFEISKSGLVPCGSSTECPEEEVSLYRRKTRGHGTCKHLLMEAVACAAELRVWRPSTSPKYTHVSRSANVLLGWPFI